MESLSKGVHLPEQNYPVDISFLDYNTLRKSTEDFMACLETNSPSDNWLVLPSGAKAKVTHSNIGRLSLYDDGDPLHTVLALYAPECDSHVVALYLSGKWWMVNDVLKTSNTSRSGLITVQSVGERVVLFLLSQVIFGVLERPPDENIYFSPHPAREVAKILWQDGAASGFYTVKQKVCRKYLQLHEKDRDRLYEAEAPGGWAQRRNVWLSIQLGCHSTNNSNHEQNLSEGKRESKMASDEEKLQVPDCQNAASMDAICKPQRNSSWKRKGETEEKDSEHSKQARMLN
ncbi:hypothetical protein JZ751_020350 [Albula glossodonta]|uniref:Protein FAM169B n=1 Tax=Albula glossodonta TaxID=121402 RepID=A0A8T2NT97_9TELE|nr:hypothetical protein JZ751_020350 [Albula glossodonta]